MEILSNLLQLYISNKNFPQNLDTLQLLLKICCQKFTQQTNQIGSNMIKCFFDLISYSSHNISQLLTRENVNLLVHFAHLNLKTGNYACFINYCHFFYLSLLKLISYNNDTLILQLLDHFFVKHENKPPQDVYSVQINLFSLIIRLGNTPLLIDKMNSILIDNTDLLTRMLYEPIVNLNRNKCNRRAIKIGYCISLLLAKHPVFRAVVESYVRRFPIWLSTLEETLHICIEQIIKKYLADSDILFTMPIIDVFGNYLDNSEFITEQIPSIWKNDLCLLETVIEHIFEKQENILNGNSSFSFQSPKLKAEGNNVTSNHSNYTVPAENQYTALKVALLAGAVCFTFNSAPIHTLPDNNKSPKQYIETKILTPDKLFRNNRLENSCTLLTPVCTPLDNPNKMNHPHDTYIKPNFTNTIKNAYQGKFVQSSSSNLNTLSIDTTIENQKNQSTPDKLNKNPYLVHAARATNKKSLVHNYSLPNTKHNINKLINGKKSTPWR